MIYQNVVLVRLYSYRVQAYAIKRQSKTMTSIEANILCLARCYGPYGYRRIITALLQVEGWHVNHKGVERIWHEEGLRVPARQHKRKRLYLKTTAHALDYVHYGKTMFGFMTLWLIG